MVMIVESNKFVKQKIDNLYDEYSINTMEGKQQSESFMNAVKDLIELCGDDPNRHGFEETHFRVLKAHLEYTKGYHSNQKDHLRKSIDVEHDELVIVKDIVLNSMSEHNITTVLGV